MPLVIARAHKVFLACAFSFGILFAFTWSAAHVWGQQTERQAASLDVILLIDNSTSMTGHDPDRLRIKAAKFLMDYLRVNAETMEANYWVGVANFGKEVGDSLSLHLLQNDVVRNWIHDEDLGQTDFRPPLRFSRNELKADLDTDKKMAVILFTDGRPQLTGTPMTEDELEAYFKDEGLRSLIEELQDGGVSLFVLGVGDAQKDQLNWTQLIPIDHYIPITSTADLADVYHSIVADFIGIAVSKAAILPSGREAEFEVEPYLERIVFSFLKSDPTIAINLTRPDGTPVAPTAGGEGSVNHVIFSVSNPPEGVWKVSWQGDGWVRYWVDREYPVVDVSLQAPYPYTGQPITITASVIRNGVVLTTPLRLEADIELPTGTFTRTSLSGVDQGKYVGVLAPVTRGVYAVTAVVFMASQSLPVQHRPSRIAILPLPEFPTPIPLPTDTPALAPSPTSGISPVATPEPAATPTAVDLRKWISVPAYWVPTGVLAVIAGVLFAMWFKRSRQEVERLVQEIESLLKEHQSWDEETTELLATRLDQLEGATLNMAAPVIDGLSVKLEDALQASKTDNHLLDMIYERAKTGKRIEQRALAQVVIRHSTTTENLGHVYSYPCIFNWPSAFDDAVDYTILNHQDSASTGAILEVWEAYREIVHSDDPLTPGEAKTRFGNLRGALGRAREELIKEHRGLPSSDVLIFFEEVYALYDQLWVLIEREKLQDIKLPEDSRLPYLQKIYELTRAILEVGHGSVDFGPILRNLDSSRQRGDISYVDYLALKAAVENQETLS